jgi:hypothetical protein
VDRKCLTTFCISDTADLVGKTGTIQRGKHAEQRVTVARLVGSSKLIVTLADNASNQEEFTIDRANIEFDGSSRFDQFLHSEFQWTALNFEFHMLQRIVIS